MDIATDSDSDTEPIPIKKLCGGDKDDWFIKKCDLCHHWERYFKQLPKQWVCYHCKQENKDRKE